jgi:hypothetical protein
MEVLHGIDGVLFFKKNEDWVVFGCAESVEADVTTETISVKTIGDGLWSTTRPQRHSYTLSCSGVVQYTDPDNQHNVFDSLEYQIAGTHIEWYISFKQNDKTTEYTQLRGFALVKHCNIAAPNDFVNCSVELEGKGELLRGAPPTCSLAITDYTFEQFGVSYANNKMTVNTVTGGAAASFQWRVDGGALDTSTAPEWFVNVITLPSAGIGDHVLEVWPVCDNGIAGALTTIEFTTSI